MKCYGLTQFEVSLVSHYFLEAILIRDVWLPDEIGGLFEVDWNENVYEEGSQVWFSEKTMIYCAAEYLRRYNSFDDTYKKIAGKNSGSGQWEDWEYIHLCENILEDFEKPRDLSKNKITRIANAVKLGSDSRETIHIIRGDKEKIYTKFSDFSKVRLSRAICGSDSTLHCNVNQRLFRKGFVGWAAPVEYITNNEVNLYEKFGESLFYDPCIKCYKDKYLISGHRCEFKRSSIYAYHTKHSKKRNTMKDYSCGYVYLIRAIGLDQTFKIGKSIDPANRYKAISPKMPFKTEQFYSLLVKNAYKTESHFHTKFADKRTNGEWFQLSQDDLDYIMNYKE